MVGVLDCGARSELDGGGLLTSVDGTPESADHANSSVGTANPGPAGDTPAGLVNTASQNNRGRGAADAGASNAGPGNSQSRGSRGGASNSAAGASNSAAGASNAGAGNSASEGNGGSGGTGGWSGGAGGREPDAEPPSDDLVGLWRFDEGEGSVVHDESGWQNHGTQEGGEWGSGELLTPALVDVPDHESLWLTESFTLEASVRVDSYGGGHGMIIFRGDSRAGLDPYVLSTEPDDTIQCMISDDESAPVVLTAPGERAKMCVICTLDAASSQMRLYIDGALAAETTTTVRSLGPLAQMEAPGVSFGAHAMRSSSS